ncbi:hypothetical protein [Desulfurobacterium atlanticum]|uniref:Uncharacterized protein n=1 Tax=Desulfurobacterium atlanticum TaxID=240169 RepID=A0A238YM16_9BACT|nr:hypothetical protein [Desulfurobacterium atlanticum]SNR72195.1 hypothetical protein SAMN06265340_10430 [Desulfurobacterium atlanticum]
MFQLLLVSLLILIVMLFLFSLKLYFLIDGFSTKLKEIDTRLLKIEKEHFEVKTRLEQMDNQFKMTLQKLKQLQGD